MSHYNDELLSAYAKLDIAVKTLQTILKGMGTMRNDDIRFACKDALDQIAPREERGLDGSIPGNQVK